jgi:hypothetical protein
LEERWKTAACCGKPASSCSRAPSKERVGNARMVLGRGPWAVAGHDPITGRPKPACRALRIGYFSRDFLRARSEPIRVAAQRAERRRGSRPSPSVCARPPCFCSSTPQPAAKHGSSDTPKSPRPLRAAVTWPGAPCAAASSRFRHPPPPPRPTASSFASSSPPRPRTTTGAAASPPRFTPPPQLRRRSP